MILASIAPLLAVKGVSSMISVQQLCDVGKSTQCEHPNGRWYPSLWCELDTMQRRCRDAWEVFMGRAHAIVQYTEADAKGITHVPKGSALALGDADD